MTDRELLELAARAVGYRVVGDAHPSDGLNVQAGKGVSVWRPLVDDGDAMRLAVALRFNVQILTGISGAFSGLEDGRWHYEEHGIGDQNATRRAIVRAAAEIGRAMAST